MEDTLSVYCISSNCINKKLYKYQTLGESYIQYGMIHIVDTFNQGVPSCRFIDCINNIFFLLRSNSTLYEQRQVKMTRTYLLVLSRLIYTLLYFTLLVSVIFHRIVFVSAHFLSVSIFRVNKYFNFYLFVLFIDSEKCQNTI